MSIELDGVPSPAVNSAPAAPAPNSVADSAVDHNGFTAADRVEAAKIYADTAAPLPAITPVVGNAAATPATPAQGAGVSADLTTLAGLFGADLTGVTTDDAARAALGPVLDLISRAGVDAGDPFAAPSPAPVVPTPAVPVQQTVPELTLENLLSEADLAEVPPELVGLFKKINDRQAAVLKKVIDQAKATSDELKSRDEKQVTARREEGKAIIKQRADAFLDTLGIFGKADSRNIVQTLQVEAVNKLGANIIAGLARYGAPMPKIEQIMQAAVLQYTGKLPSTAAAPAPVIPLTEIPLMPRQSQGSAGSQVRTSNATSTSNGDGLMQDAEYMAAARAVLGS